MNAKKNISTIAIDVERKCPLELAAPVYNNAIPGERLLKISWTEYNPYIKEDKTHFVYLTEEQVNEGTHKALQPNDKENYRTAQWGAVFIDNVFTDVGFTCSGTVDNDYTFIEVFGYTRDYTELAPFTIRVRIGHLLKKIQDGSINVQGGNMYGKFAFSKTSRFLAAVFE